MMLLRSRVTASSVWSMRKVVVRTPRYWTEAAAAKKKKERGLLNHRKQSTWFQAYEDPIETWAEKCDENAKLTLRELLNVARPEWRLIGFALSCQLITSSVTMLFPMAFGKLVDGLQSDDAAASLKRITSVLGVVMSVAAFATASRVSTMGIVGERIALRLRRVLYQSLLRQEIEFFDRGKSGELINRLSTDVTSVSKFLTDNLTRMVRSTVTSCTGIGALLYLSPKLALVCMAVVPIAAFTSSKLGTQVREIAEQVQYKMAMSTQAASEKITALRTVRAFGGEQIEVDAYGTKITEAYLMGKKLAKVEGVYTGANFLAANMTLATVLYVGGTMVIGSEISIGTLTSVCMYMVNLGFGVSNLANAYGQLLRAQGCGARVFELINRSPKSNTSTLSLSNVKKTPQAIPPRTVSPLVCFENVSFGYPDKRELLRDVSMSIQAGEIVAVTGQSGSGKSTLLSLASRFHDPSAGTVSISGLDVTEWDTKALRNNVAVVPQDVILFEGTIAENIAYSAEGRTREDIVSAARISRADAFVEAMPLKYDTIVGERGQTLSGGQRKLIGLARALVRKPRLLILDEALTGLDGETERAVAMAVKELARGGIGVLLIAHGVGPSLQMADRTFQISDGKAIEIGRTSQR